MPILNIISDTGIFVIGFVSLGYFLFGRVFAEFCINFNFLNFPIFVGEIALFICSVLLLIKFYLINVKFAKWHYFVLAYIVFILSKTIFGYFVYGPLALRHAAEFYYPLCMFFGYSFYRKDFFNAKVILFLLILFIAIFRIETLNSYALITGIVLFVVLLRKYAYKKIKYILLIFLLLGFPYISFLFSSRTMLVSNLVVLMFLFIAIFLIVRIKKIYQFFIITALVSLVVMVVVKISDQSNKIKSFTHYAQGLILYNKYSGIIEKEKINFKMKELGRVKLYNPDVKAGYKDEPALNVSMERKSKGQFSGREPQPQAKEPQPQAKEPQPQAKEPQPQAKKSQLQTKEPQSFAQRTSFQVEQVSSRIQVRVAKPIRTLEIEQGNILFRLFIWENMLREIIDRKQVLGFDFGKPLRSKSLEVLNWAQSEWERDGWVAAHNSYLDIIYRAGVVGILFVLSIFIGFFMLVRRFVQYKSITGILLCGALISWLVAANFLVILELPYNAIPFWSLFGMTFAYSRKFTKE